MGPSQRELLKKKFWFVWGAATNKGRQREGNEDAFATAADTGLFLVSDGMGGHQGGEIASQIVADDLPVMIEAGLENLRSHSVNSIRQYLKRSVAAQSEHLRMEAEEGDGHKEMGATVVVLLIAADRAYIASAGDSRAYLLRDDKLSQVTKDHSTVEELIDARVMDGQQGLNSCVDQFRCVRCVWVASSPLNSSLDLLAQPPEDDVEALRILRVSKPVTGPK